jgi:hypothetical protein
VHSQGIHTGSTHLDDGHHAQESLHRSLGRVREYGAAFSEQAREIVHTLQEHKDLDCRSVSLLHLGFIISWVIAF